MLAWLLYKTVKFKSMKIIFGGRKTNVFIADSFAKQLVGLMYRDSIDSDQGMLFIFGRDSKWGIWMAHMKFSIDIVWIGKDGTVVDLNESAKPCASIFDCKTYYPKAESRFVLELPAGNAKRMHIGIGSRIFLPNRLLRNLK
ncbi:MAG: DUF192 domain-containing protein [Candidatus Micrarchaeaceae archaeon]